MTLPSSTATLLEVAATYRTCEFATVTRDGTPMTWPAVCTVGAAGITLTTSIGLPVKAFNIRRDPRVALLFSDPTGTGRTDLPQVLVRGTATCPDEIRTSPAGLEDYWLQLWERQPDVVDTSTALARRIMDFYYLRLVMTVTPQEVTGAPPLQRSPGDHAGPVPRRRDRSPWGQAVRRLGAYPDAVLGWCPDGEPPVLRRVRVTAAPDRLDLDPVAGDPLPSSRRAGLMFHGHDDRLAALRQFAVLGAVSPEGGFRPDRYVPGAAPESPLALPATLVRLRRTARRYLDRRDLPRPPVDWAAFEALRTRA
jgi:Pyridoxamine 5'-phosphate oxidase